LKIHEGLGGAVQARWLGRAFFEDGAGGGRGKGDPPDTCPSTL